MNPEDLCPETPVNVKCLLCERQGSWERPVVNIADWYPKPRPPEPCPEPVGPFYTFGRVLALLAFGFLFFYLLFHIL